MIIDENTQIVGTGSWFYTQKKSDYPYCETVRDFLAECYKLCDFRLSQYPLEIGQCVRVTVVGGKKIKRLTGIVQHIKDGSMEDFGENIGYHYTIGRIVLKQKNKTITIESNQIDEIEFLDE